MMNKKNLKSLKNDKRAVSPVIGVILMVAITVILAAVIAAFVFGVAPPATTMDLHATVRADASAVTLTFAGSDSVATGACQVLVRDLDAGTAEAVNISAISTIYPAGSAEVKGGTVVVIKDIDLSGVDLPGGTGNELNVVVTDTSSGTILTDAVVRVKS